MSIDANGTSYDPITVQPVANGFIVRGEHNFQTNGPRNPPIEWHVFQSFDAMADFLRKQYVVKL